MWLVIVRMERCSEIGSVSLLVTSSAAPLPGRGRADTGHSSGHLGIVGCRKACKQCLTFDASTSFSLSEVINYGFLYVRYLINNKLECDEAPEHFLVPTVINSPHAQKFMVSSIFSVVLIFLDPLMDKYGSVLKCQFVHQRIQEDGHYRENP